MGTMGRRTVQAAAAWADGLAGFTLDLDAAAAAELFALARDAWQAADRPAPRLATSFWFAIHDDRDVARAQVHRHLRHYMSWLPTEPRRRDGAHDGLRRHRRRAARRARRGWPRRGADEVHLVPTSADRRQLDAVAQLVA